MSSTFEVYPSVADIPTFEQLLNRVNVELHRFFQSVDIAARLNIEVCIQRHADHELVPFALTDPFTWSDDCYAWFFLDGVPGGTDAYLREITDGKTCGMDIQEMLLEPARGEANRALIQKCSEQDHYWSFRCSAGQPDTIRLVRGLIAGSLGELTSGLIYSVDGAWDWELMPATPDEFLSYYFVPVPFSKHWGAWVQSSIANIAKVFKGSD